MNGSVCLFALIPVFSVCSFLIVRFGGLLTCRRVDGFLAFLLAEANDNFTIGGEMTRITLTWRCLAKMIFSRSL